MLGRKKKIKRKLKKKKGTLRNKKNKRLIKAK